MKEKDFLYIPKSHLKFMDVDEDKLNIVYDGFFGVIIDLREERKKE